MKVLEELLRVRVSEYHGAVNEGSPGTGDLLGSTDDVPDDLLGPGGPALGAGHDPHVVWPGLDLVDEVVVLHVSGIHRQQPLARLSADHPH